MHFRFSVLSITVLFLTGSVIAAPLAQVDIASPLEVRAVHAGELERGLRPGMQTNTATETTTRKRASSLDNRNVHSGELERGLNPGMQTKTKSDSESEKRAAILDIGGVHASELERGLAPGVKMEAATDMD